MITKERLQELIEQGATVYYIKHRNGAYIKPLKLEKDYKSEFIYRNLMLDEKDLYEHKADAEWDLEFENVEKRIKFVKPKSFRKVSEYIFKVNEEARTSLNHNIYVNYGFILNVSDDFILRLSYKCEIIFEKPFNEENYTEACRLIKKLFMEEA